MVSDKSSLWKEMLMPPPRSLRLIEAAGDNSDQESPGQANRGCRVSRDRALAKQGWGEEEALSVPHHLASGL